MTNFIAPYWEYPATVWCVHCHEPLELTWSSSAVNQRLYHGACYKTHNKEKEQK